VPRLVEIDNGIPVVCCDEMPFRSVTISVAVGMSSRDEDRASLGMSHVLEHTVMAAPLPAVDGTSFTEWVDGVGGQVNAATGKEFVTFWARVPEDQGSRAAALLASAVAEPSITDAVCAAELRVVQNELEAAAADPIDRAQTEFFGTLFQGHPLGNPVGGVVDALPQVSAAALDARQRATVRKAPIAVAIVGAAHAAGEVSDAIGGSALASAQRSRVDTCRAVPTPPGPAPYRPEPGDHAKYGYLTCGGIGASRGTEESAAVEVLAAAVGGTPGSMLYRSLRNDLGLTYELQSITASYEDTGVWRVVVGCSPTVRVAVVEAIQRCLSAVADGAVGADVVDAARRQAIGTAMIDNEDPVARSFLLAHEVASRGLPAPSEIDPVGDAVSRLKRVDSAALSAAAVRVLDSFVVVEALA
jgi:predicted Zn-dependent peptidase